MPGHGSWVLWVAPAAPQCTAGSYEGTANHDIAAEPDRSKRPRDRGPCRGPTSAHRSSPRAPHHPKVACNSGDRTFSSTPKRCNSNDVISMFEMFTWELHATFLRNHNARPRRTHAEDVQAQKTYKPTRKLKPRRRPHPRPPQLPEAQGRCTRYGTLHPNRRGALSTDRVQCPNTQEQTRNWQTEPLTATTSPGTGRRAGNDDPVSADSGPSPRPRWLQYRSASPVRRYGRPQFRRPAPCR